MISLKKLRLKIKDNLLAISLLILGILIYLKGIKFGKNLIGDIYDGRFNNFILEHFYRALAGKEDSFINANFFYPLPNTIQLSENHWLPGIIYACLRIVGIDSHTSFNLWVLFGFIINFLICYLVLIKFNFSKKTSALGAYLFAFNQIILQKIGHMQLNFKAFIPLTILFAKQYFDTRNIKYISYIILCILLQTMCSPYNGSFLALYIFIIFSFYLSKFKIDDLAKFTPIFKDIKITIIIFITAIALSFIYGKPYAETKNIYDLNYPMWIGYGFELHHLFIIDSPIWRFIGNYFNQDFLKPLSENQFFMGFGVWFGIIYFIFNRNLHKKLQDFDKIIIKSTIFMIIFFWLDNYIYNFAFLQIALPNFTNLRVYGRFFYVAFFGFIYLTCLVLQNINLKNYYNKILYYILLSILIIEPLLLDKLSSSNINESRQEANQHKNLIINNSHNKESITLFLLSKNNQNFEKITKNEINAMISSRDLNIKTINGYGSRFLLGQNVVNNCQEVKNLIKEKERKINKILNRKKSLEDTKGKDSSSNKSTINFQYDYKNLLIFLDGKLCNF